jgi:hypothetical protein
MASATNLLSPTSTWTAMRDRVRGVRLSHMARKSLERDLAAYTSENDLNDIEAILDRYSDAETVEIRRILAGRHN